MPTTVEPQAVPANFTSAQVQLVSNAIDRSLCRELSARFVIRPRDEAADLVIQVIITRLTPTDTTAAGVSAVTGMGGKVISAATGVPLAIPRVPYGLGSLTVEAEAKDGSARQRAAMIWARGADALTTDPRVAGEGDAHTLANRFAEDFAKLLITGTDPVADPVPLLPTGHSLGEYFGGKPKYAACEQFGRHPGVGDTLGSKIGLPPSWTDSGPNSR